MCECGGARWLSVSLWSGDKFSKCKLFETIARLGGLIASDRTIMLVLVTNNIRIFAFRTIRSDYSAELSLPDVVRDALPQSHIRWVTGTATSAILTRRRTNHPLYAGAHLARITAKLFRIHCVRPVHYRLLGSVKCLSNIIFLCYNNAVQ